MDPKHRDSFEIKTGSLGVSALPNGAVEPFVAFSASLFSGIFFLVCMKDVSNGDVLFGGIGSLISGGVLLAALRYLFLYYHFITVRQKLIVNKQGITIATNTWWSRPVFIPLDRIDRVEALLYEKDGNSGMHVYLNDKRVPMIVAGVKRYPILLAASPNERERGQTAINDFLQQHQRKPAKTKQVFSVQPRMTEIEQCLPRPPRGSKIKTYIDEKQNVVIVPGHHFSLLCAVIIFVFVLFYASVLYMDPWVGVLLSCVMGIPSVLFFYAIGADKSHLELNRSGLTIIRTRIIKKKEFLPITKIDSFELYETRRVASTRNSTRKKELYTALKITSCGDEFFKYSHVEEKRWLKQYLTEYSRIIRKNGMAQVVAVEKKHKKKEPESEFQII